MGVKDDVEIEIGAGFLVDLEGDGVGVEDPARVPATLLASAPAAGLLATLNDLPSDEGGGRPANIAPLSAASAAFLALFSSLAISAISSKLSFLFKPSIPLQPGFDFLGVLGRSVS